MAVSTRICSVLSKDLFLFKRLGYSTSTQLVTKYDLELLRHSKKNYKYILDEELAFKVAHSLGSLHDVTLIETNPGPGVLSKALFEAGATHIIGLEPERRFHPALWHLKEQITPPKRFDLLHGDFSKLDPHSGSVVNGAQCTPPAISSEDVLANVLSQPWESDGLVARFLGIETASNPSVLPRVLLSHLSQMVSQRGIFEKGRCELAFFYAEERAEKITAQFGSKHFSRLTLMVSLFCDVQVLLRVPCRRFYPVHSREKDKFLTLVSIVPKKIPLVSVSSHDLHYLNYFIRLLLVKPQRRVVDAIESISPGGHAILNQLNWSHDVSIRDLCSQDIGKLASAFFQWEGRSLHFYYDAGCNEQEHLKFM
ncbi:dimethyladenosine transferase 1, mitochondrial-like [Montipora capricornis]|uniref:dimethyladenosine transferase 1, mitochondrial-like n=1 Tax=Montipora capricornis TaxID=246305 RepID=UPI0035F1FEC2